MIGQVKKAIDKKYSKRGIFTDTLEDMTARNVLDNAQFMVLLKGFAVMAMVIGSFGIINITPYLVEATSNLLLPMHYFIKTFSIAFILGIIIMIIASIGPALKSSKLNIIDSIKYE